MRSMAAVTPYNRNPNPTVILTWLSTKSNGFLGGTFPLNFVEQFFGAIPQTNKHRSNHNLLIGGGNSVNNKQLNTKVSGVENIGQCGRLSQLSWLLGAL